MKRLATIIAAASLALAGTSATAGAKQHLTSIRRHPTPAYVQGAAVTTAARYFHGLPCQVTLEKGYVPAGWGMGRAGCAIVYHGWDGALRQLQRDPKDGYSRETWQLFCVDTIEEVSSMRGLDLPDSGSVYERLARACGPRP